MTTGTVAPRCVFCGRPAEHRHHWTGRLEPTGPYLDSAATVPLCRLCHYVEHAAWRSVGIDDVPDPLRARVRRSTWLFGRLADLERPVTLDAATIRGAHAVCLAIGDDLDRRDERAAP